MISFIKMDNNIIVIEYEIIIDIYEIKTKKEFIRIGSGINKYFINKHIDQQKYILFDQTYKKNKKIDKYLIFNDLFDLQKFYNIEYDISKCGILYTYYSYNSKIKKEEYYHINYKKEGVYKKYDYNGNIIIEGTYINNILNGEYKIYRYSKYKTYEFSTKYNNNNLNDIFTIITTYNYTVHGIYENNKIIYYEKKNIDNKLMEKIYITNDNIYVCEEYNIDTTKLIKVYDIFIKNILDPLNIIKNGKYIEYHNNGEIYIKCNYKYDNIIGEYILYDNFGNIIYQHIKLY